MATQPKQQDDTQKQQGQGRVAAGGFDDEGHPLTKDGHVDHRMTRSEDNHDDNQQETRGSSAKSKRQDDEDEEDENESSKSSKSASRSTQHKSSNQGHTAAGGHDKEGNPLTKDGHVDHRTKAGRGA